MQIAVDTDGYVIGYAEAGFKVNGGMEYEGDIPEGFDAGTYRGYRLIGGQLYPDPAKFEQMRKARELAAELDEIQEWFAWYDLQVAQYLRAARLGEAFDGDITMLDTEAAQKQARIREIREDQAWEQF